MVTAPKIDDTGKTVTITIDGLVKIDKLTACRRIIRNGIIYIQFRDKDRLRSQCRGTEFVEIPMVVLFEILSLMADGSCDFRKESYEA